MTSEVIALELMSRINRFAMTQQRPVYCGRLGAIREFEAESVCYLVCGRAGIDNPSDKYLACYIGQNSRVPEIGLECVMAASGLIEKMGRERLKPRKDGAQKKLTER